MSRKIGFYIRVSTEEQAKNIEGSIRNQKDRLTQAVKFKNMDGNFGEVTGIFIDEAKSGKDTNRPELQRLLALIEQKEITMVMVSELSRLSRNMKDFAEIWELMKRQGCGIYSLRENFDTTSAAGEMVLYTIANIAQFERRQVSERVHANMRARAERGLYNGGSVPFGYKLIADKKGYLAVDDDCAEVVKVAFSSFLKQGSLSTTARWLNEHGITLKRAKEGGGRFHRLSHFTVENLYKILTNKVYLGLKCYNVGTETRTSKAVWPALVDEEVFNKVQARLKANRSKLKPSGPHRYPYLLSGLVYCAKCGDSMCGKSAHGANGKIAYYEHSWATKRESCLSKKFFDCQPYRVMAKKLEPFVLDKIKELIFEESDLAIRLVNKAHDLHLLNSSAKEVDALKAKVSGINSQLNALAERLSLLPASVPASPIYQQMEFLQGKKDGHLDELRKLETHKGMVNGPPIQLSTYQGLLKSFESEMIGGNTDLIVKIIQRLIQRIEVGESSVKIFYNLAKDLAA